MFETKRDITIKKQEFVVLLKKQFPNLKCKTKIEEHKDDNEVWTEIDIELTYPYKEDFQREVENFVSIHQKRKLNTVVNPDGFADYINIY